MYATPSVLQRNALASSRGMAVERAEALFGCDFSCNFGGEVFCAVSARECSAAVAPSSNAAHIIATSASRRETVSMRALILFARKAAAPVLRSEADNSLSAAPAVVNRFYNAFFARFFFAWRFSIALAHVARQHAPAIF